MQTYLTNISIYTENEIIPKGALLIEGGRIKEIHDEPQQKRYEHLIDGGALIAVPGYIDTHCHGGGGYDCVDGTVEAIVGMRHFYASHGVTTLYPTLPACGLDTIRQGLEIIRTAITLNKAGTTRIEGCHLEGPFLNRQYRGAQHESSIIPLNEEGMPIYEDFCDVIKRTTIAPEVQDNASYFPALKEMGIQLSIGHSAATYQEVKRAVSLGATSVTHLYNAMSQTKKEGPFRVGGVVEAGLTIDDLYAEIIADGNHLTNELIEIIHRCKGPDKILLCSDASRLAGSDSKTKTAEMNGVPIVIENGVAMNAARTSLAASIMPVDGMVRHLIFNVGLPIHDVLKMASINSAKMMGIDQRVGSIAVGKEADINLVDRTFHVVKTLFKGAVRDQEVTL